MFYHPQTHKRIHSLHERISKRLFSLTKPIQHVPINFTSNLLLHIHSCMHFIIPNSFLVTPTIILNNFMSNIFTLCLSVLHIPYSSDPYIILGTTNRITNLNSYAIKICFTSILSTKFVIVINFLYFWLEEVFVHDDV